MFPGMLGNGNGFNGYRLPAAWQAALLPAVNGGVGKAYQVPYQSRTGGPGAGVLAYAKLTVVAPGGAGYEAKTLTIQGPLAAKTFEFDNAGNGVAGGNVPVVVTGLTAPQVQAALLAAIQGQQATLGIVATAGNNQGGALTSDISIYEDVKGITPSFGGSDATNLAGLVSLVAFSGGLAQTNAIPARVGRFFAWLPTSANVQLVGT